MKRKILTTSAAAMIAMTAFAGPAQALVSQTDAPQNEQTDAIARLQFVKKKDLQEALDRGETKVSVKATICTSTLIDPQWVISAGHCSKDGMENLYATATFGIDKNSDKKYTITQVEKFSEDNDIALYKLDKPVEGITPLKMWDGLLTKDTEGTAYGWGRVEGTPSLNTLNTLEGVMSPDESFGSPYPKMGTNMAKFDKGYTATGDSGSPFIINNAVYGVLSMGITPENQDEFPGSLYMPTAKYQEWIKGVTQSDDDAFISTPDAERGDTNSPDGDTRPIEAEVPKDDSSIPVTEVDTSTKPTGKTTSDSDETGASSKDEESEEEVSENDTSSEDTSMKKTPATRTNVQKSTTTSSSSTPASNTTQVTPVSSNEEAYGPKVNTGGTAQSESFFGKVMKVFA